MKVLLYKKLPFFLRMKRGKLEMPYLSSVPKGEMVLPERGDCPL